MCTGRALILTGQDGVVTRPQTLARNEKIANEHWNEWLFLCPCESYLACVGVHFQIHKTADSQ